MCFNYTILLDYYLHHIVTTRDYTYPCIKGLQSLDAHIFEKLPSFSSIFVQKADHVNCLSTNFELCVRIFIHAINIYLVTSALRDRTQPHITRFAADVWFISTPTLFMA